VIVGVPKAASGDAEQPCVVLQLRLEPVELDVREVVALDSLPELDVDQVDLLANLLRLGSLGLDLSGIRRRRADAEEDRCGQDEECRCVSSLRADDGSRKRTEGSPGTPPQSQAGHPSKPGRRRTPPTEGDRADADNE
jgi:hypothetical protein